MSGASDLAAVPHVSDDVIVSCLWERFMSDTIYTALGASALVALNLHKYVSPSGDSVLNKYATEYCASNKDKEILPPHIFRLVSNVYYHMRRTTQDQSIIFSSNPTDCTAAKLRLAIKLLLDLSVSAPGKKGSKLAQQVPAASFVLESFSNARTLFNPNASHSGAYTELQFSDRGRQNPRLLS
ncbi:P-loop containing nucleoside triphosphate hydrolase protein [Mycena maculata]|uniref:P-loop containing nucleoside triphosphate hydrolase protein n=1 Tax=Mycena maculata TaxID=230809 RepID=A0AAD7N6A3_9AGAR|nr:P-loop containing nucleoside triphosphate hydrolase protein [Mycena maculata]